MPIIDCHVHLNHYADESQDRLADCLDDLRVTMRRNRVGGAVILTSYKDVPGRPSTRAVVEAIRNEPHLHVVAGLSFERFNEATVEELDDLLVHKLIVGLKLYPGYEPFYPFDSRMEPAFALAAKYRVPVMIHCGDTYTPKGKVKYAHPLHVDELAVDHPDVNFVICHLGNPWLRDCMEVVYKNANVYADISGLVLGDFTDRFEKYMREQMQELLLYGMSPDNVLYGTDWPISTMESYLDFVEDLKVPPADRRKMMYENAARLFGIPVPDSGGTIGDLFGRL